MFLTIGPATSDLIIHFYVHNSTGHSILYTMTIPDSLHRFFWDVDVKRLDPEKKPYFVINRLLDKGDIEAAKATIKKIKSR